MLRNQSQLNTAPPKQKLVNLISDGINMNSKEMYTSLLKGVGCENPNDIFEILSGIRNIHYAFRELKEYFEFKPQYTVLDNNLEQVSLYDFLKKYEINNTSLLNLHIYFDGECVGNICDGWIEGVPDHIKENLFLIV